jgi:hypothetical protein
MIFRFDNGSLIPNSYFLTNIKSPTTRLGIIEPDGIRYGSIINDRNIRTKARMGKREATKLTKALSFKSFINNFTSKYKVPERRVNKINNKVKSIVISLAS